MQGAHVHVSLNIYKQTYFVLNKTCYGGRPTPKIISKQQMDYLFLCYEYFVHKWWLILIYIPGIICHL
jgi:hypothetical protein